MVSIGSSLLSDYRLLVSNYDREMKAFVQRPGVARDEKRFRETSQTIRGVEDLLNNRAALTVALSAFQLESEVNSRALIKRILTEPLSDKKSLVNRLADNRWRKFAEAFSPAFASDTTAQRAKLLKGVTEAYDTISSASKIDMFVKNPTAMRAAMGAVGMDKDANGVPILDFEIIIPGGYGDQMKKVLTTSDLTDPTTLGSRLQDERWRNYGLAFAAMFKADGTTQPPEALKALTSTYRTLADKGLDRAAFLADKELLGKALGAFGIGQSELTATLAKQVLSGSFEDPAAVVNKTGDARWRAFGAMMAAAFDRGGAAGQATRLRAVADVYEGMTTAGTLNAFLGDGALMKKSLTAFGLEGTSEKVKETVAGLVLENPLKKDSLSSVMMDKRWRSMASMFGTAFKKDGTVRSREANEAVWIALKRAQRYDNAYEAAGDRRLVQMMTDAADAVADAAGLSSTASPYTREQMARALGEDPTAPGSLAAERLAKDPKLRLLGMVFGPAFRSGGSIHDAKFVDKVVEGFRTNEFEKAQEEERSPALREALYFRRTAGSVKSAFQILADPALAKVVRGALNLPDQFATLDIDMQAKLINRNIKVDKLNDPAYREKLVQKYLIMEEIRAGEAESPYVSLLQPLSYGGEQVNLFA